MKKIIVLLSIVLLSITGCTVNKLDNKNITSNINILLSQKSKVTNASFEGYKYYVPKGLKFLNKEDYNAVFRDRFDNKYYLFVDVIGYYHKVENTYEVDDEAYYSDIISYNDKDGYIEINKVDDNKYYIQYVFNYGRMQALIDSKYLTTVVNNMSYILRSIVYNDEVLDSLVGENILSYSEENFSLFEIKATREDFLDVVEKYDSGYKEAKDHEKLELNDE